MYQIRKQTIDKTQRFSATHLALTHVESKFCMGGPWNEVYGMPICVKGRPAAPIIGMMGWDIL